MESDIDGLKISGIHIPGSLQKADSFSGSMLYRKIQGYGYLNFAILKFEGIFFCVTSVKKMNKQDTD